MKCLVSGAKRFSVTFENNIPPTLNPKPTVLTNPTKGRNPFVETTDIWACFSKSFSSSIMTHVLQNSYPSPHLKCNAVPGGLPSKFTTSEKTYIWSWLCDANFNKSCTMVKVFWDHITVLCKVSCKNKSLLIDNMPHNHNVCEEQYKIVVLPQVFTSAENGTVCIGIRGVQ